MSDTFFIDRNLGKKFVYSLRECGVSAEMHDDHFDQNTIDVVWIPVVESRGWIIVTKDDRIRYRPLELAVVIHSHARLLLLSGRADLTAHATNLINSGEVISGFAIRNSGAWMAKLHRPAAKFSRTRENAAGTVEMWRRGSEH